MMFTTAGITLSTATCATTDNNWEDGNAYTYYYITVVGEGKVEVGNIAVSPWTENEEDIPLETE